jgi:predicted amidohydrolase YtcJ
MIDRASLIISGRMATLAGDAGLGWAEAVAIGGDRVIAAGRSADLEGLAGPATRRLALGPDEVGLPGLSDAHLHLGDAALAADRVDLAAATTYAEGLEAIAAAHWADADPATWLTGQGWDAERWGGWPTADDLERVAPGRRAAFWAHDHHSSWVSRAALAEAGIEAATPDPPGGVIRRDDAGTATGVLHETAARLVTLRIPATTVEVLASAIERLAGRLVAAGVVAVHDPASIVPDPALELAYPAYGRLAEGGRLRLRVHACLRDDGLDEAIRRGLRSGSALGDPAGGIRVGWVKLFADGTLGSRTAAMLAPFESEPDRPAPPGGPTGVWITPPERLAALAGRAAAHGIAAQIHAIGDAAARAALDALEPTAGRASLVPRLEHVQLVDPPDLGRFAGAGIAASIQPIHLRADAGPARRAWGARAERSGYPWASLAASGALIPFGTDAPVEPWDPWPGLELAVTRRDRSWAADAEPFGPSEGLSLDRAVRGACLDPALSAGETTRGRLVAGHRADIVVIPAAALREPVEPGGPLGHVRPRLVLVGGEIAAEA